MFISRRRAAFAATLLITSVVVAHHALAQAPEPPVLTGRITRLPVDSSGDPNFGRCQAGNLTPDHRPDALVRNGGSFVCVSAVDTLGYRVNLDTALDYFLVRDAVIAPGTGRDTVFFLGELEGDVWLVETRFAYLEESLASADAFVPIHQVTRTELQSASRLAVGNFDGDQELDVFVLAGTDVLRFERVTDGSIAYVDAISVGAGCTELALSRVSSNSRDDLVVFGGGNVLVRSLNSSEDWNVAVPATIRSVSAWHCSVADAGRVAIVTREWVESSPTVFNDLTRLYVRGVNYAEPTVSLGGLLTADAIGADFLGIGTQTLILVNQYGPVIVSLFNFGGPPQGASTTFSATDPARGAAEEFAIDPQTNMLSQSGRSAASDIDNDGDLDVLFACEATGDLHVKRNPTVDEVAVSAQITKVLSLYDSFPSVPNGFGQHFRLGFVSSSFAPQTTHVQVSIYQVLNDDNASVQPSPVLAHVGAAYWDVSNMQVVGPTEWLSPETELLAAYATYGGRVVHGSGGYDERANYSVIARGMKNIAGAVVPTGPELIYKFGHSRSNNDADDEPDIGNPDPIEPEPLPPPPQRQPPSTP